MQLAVETPSGALQGRARHGVALFAGIPYAAAPIDDLRWAPPQRREVWSGLLDATKFGKVAPQLPGLGLTNRTPHAWDEDCLTLNVCTPAADDGRRPVMVWIHGGAYNHGTGATPWYDGTSFATRGDIVVVTINYRLGALGFCRVDGEPTAGINGILDQVAALEWVRDNIAAFGGDPNQVTIAGESAGAFSVSTLTAMPRAEGLFGRAIAQSGAGHHVLSREIADEVASEFFGELKVSSTDQARGRTALEVLEAQQRVEARGHEFMSRTQQPFYPCVGGEILPARPVDMMANGAGARVPMLTGTNADETTLFGLSRMSTEELHQLVRHYTDQPASIIDRYQAAHPEAKIGELAVMLTTDHTFRIPAVRMAEARAANGADTWMYLFNWKSQAFGGALGATHALEIPFAFATLESPGVDAFLGTPELPFALSRLMHDAWINFIQTGSPCTDAMPEWPTYQPESRRVMELSDYPALLEDPDPSLREVWEGVR